MNTPVRSGLIIAVACFAVSSLNAEGPFRNRDNKNAAKDSAEGTYPIPYQLPKVEEVTADLARIRDYLDRAAPLRIVDSATGKEITDPASVPVETAGIDRGEMEFSPLQYEMGVVDSAMLRAAAVTGDAKFAGYVRKHAEFVAKWLPYFQASAKKFGPDKNGFRSIIEPRPLDDSGSMCAGLIRARIAKVGPDLDV